MAKAVLFSVLGVLAAVFGMVWVVSELRAHRTPTAAGSGRSALPTLNETIVGFVTNFFDTLGIGSFAPTTSLFKIFRMVDDRLIPGTLNVGHTPPVVVQAYIFITILAMDMRTLASLIAGAVLGAWFGAGIVAGWPRRTIQLGMGAALLVAATLMAMGQLQWFPSGGEAIGLDGVRLTIAIGGMVVLGALMTLGIGLYAPSMIMISLLGMNPKLAFPVMMGSCAFLMPVGSIRFIKKRSFSPGAALGLALGGLPAVLIAAFLVKALPLDTMRWLVVVVVVYTAVMMLRSARAERRAAGPVEEL